MEEDTMKNPQIDSTAYVAPGARIIGDVCLKQNTSVWYNAVLRGDIEKITVGANSNVQDNCTLHCDFGTELVIGENVTIGHNAVLHSCRIGDDTLIGMGAILLGGVKVGKNCLVAAGAVLTPGMVVPEGSMVMGFPARVKRKLTEEEKLNILSNAAVYVKLSQDYRLNN
jgi:carbonic anhydrase/acetyltransferase-like protein (isoleucine patch superfamily)